MGYGDIFEGRLFEKPLVQLWGQSETMSKKNTEKLSDGERERMHVAMLSSVSHDLKTPLASIIGSLEIYERMHDKLSSDKKDALIRMALGESYRLDNFITNILDMAKLENNLVSLHEDVLQLDTLLRDVLIKLGPRIDKEKVELPKSYPLKSVTTDGTLFARALFIALDNAAKHGGYPITISMNLSADSKQLHITIADSGPGIPRGSEHDIFAKYTRFTKMDHQHAGTGLGLAICREIMRLLNGAIDVLPATTGGAQFTFSLPVK